MADTNRAILAFGVSPWSWLLLLLAITYIAWFWSNPWGYSPYPDLAGDAEDYLTFARWRTAGYPLFVQLVMGIFGTVDAIPKLHIILNATALAFLSWCLLRVLDAPVLALMPFCASFALPDLTRFHGAILTESLTVALLCVMLGAFILLLERPTWRRAAISALACGLAITIKPATVSLLLIWPLALWVLWHHAHQRLQVITAVVAPLLLCLLAEQMIWRLHHGAGPRPSVTDAHLFAKAMMVEPEPSIPDAELARIRAMGREVFAPARRLVADAPDARMRILLLVIFEHTGQVRTYQRTLSQPVRELAQQRGTDRWQIRKQIAWATLRGAPMAWLQNALSHYWALWSAYSSYDAAFTDSVHAYISPLAGSALLEDALITTPIAPSGNERRWMMAVALAASILAPLLLMALALRRHLGGMAGVPADNRLVVACLCGLMIHAHFLLVGLVGIVQMRYVFSTWPLMALCLLLLIDWALGCWRHRRGATAASPLMAPEAKIRRDHRGPWLNILTRRFSQKTWIH